MKRISSRNILVLVLIAFAVLAVVGYFGRGWIRTAAIPGFYSLTKGSAMKGKVEAEMEKLGKPFESLGYQKIDKKQKCELSNARLLRTEVTCTYRIDASHIIARSWVSPAELVINGTTLQQQLQQNGWRGDFIDENDTTSLREFMMAMSKNIDSTPDATYTKNLDGMSCSFSNVAASASPSPAAMATHLICEQQFRLF